MPDLEQAVQQLERALKEQARLGDQYERSSGTSAELSSYVRLQAAGLRVSICERVVKNARRTGGLPAEGS